MNQLDREYIEAAALDRGAEHRMSPVCPDCGSNDEHPPTCPYRQRIEAEEARAERQERAA